MSVIRLISYLGQRILLGTDNDQQPKISPTNDKDVLALMDILRNEEKKYAEMEKSVNESKNPKAAS